MLYVSTSKLRFAFVLNLVTGTFVHVRVELAKCIANPSCAANVACLQTCNNRPDETECQVRFCFICISILINPTVPNSTGEKF